MKISKNILLLTCAVFATIVVAFVVFSYVVAHFSYVDRKTKVMYPENIQRQEAINYMVETYSIEKDMFVDFDIEQFIDDYEIEEINI